MMHFNAIDANDAKFFTTKIIRRRIKKQKEENV